MAIKAKKFCRHIGCNALVSDDTHCPLHKPIYEQQRASALKWQDKQRPNARARGYSYRWSKYSKSFLKQPGIQFCALHLDSGCAGVAECVDHIIPHSGERDPLFWDKANHQAACIHCNSVKGNKALVGSHRFGGSL